MARLQYLRLQKEQYVAHIAKQPACIDVFYKLQKDRVYCHEKWLYHSAGCCFTLFGRKETPAPKGSLLIDKTLIMEEKWTGNTGIIVFFFWRIFPIEAKGSQFIGGEGRLIALAFHCVMHSL